MGSDIIQFLKAKAYRKIRDLGHGATGQTVLLHDDSIDEDFVCKKYVPYYDYYKEECYKRFVDEIKILYKMNHPRIVRVFNKIGFVSPERRYEAPTVGMLGMCIV